MSKNREQKRKALLETRAKNESFRFQVEFLCKQKGIDITEWKQELDAELDAICQNGITDALSNLLLIIEGVQKELGHVQEVDKCSLNGTLVPFILGITPFQPDRTTYVQGVFAAETPIQVRIAYDNEIRNEHQHGAARGAGGFGRHHGADESERHGDGDVQCRHGREGVFSRRRRKLDRLHFGRGDDRQRYGHFPRDRRGRKRLRMRVRRHEHRPGAARGAGGVGRHHDSDEPRRHGYG